MAYSVSRVLPQRKRYVNYLFNKTFFLCLKEKHILECLILGQNFNKLNINCFDFRKERMLMLKFKILTLFLDFLCEIKLKVEALELAGL